MQKLSTPKELADMCRNWRKGGRSVALVPTMGSCHAGHEDLMRHGRALADRLVISLFVNPAQFSPAEDLQAYPRVPDQDAAVAKRCGADVLFTPDTSAMYMPDHATWVDVPEMSGLLCGMQRPTHFRGVCTVVLKLFLLTLADVAVFGEKDWQQQALLRRMARDLNVPTRIETRATVREPDGLALSSRNVYMTVDERAQAPEIYRALQYAGDMVAEGESNAATLRAAVLRRWSERLPLGRLDYLAVVNPETLLPIERIDAPARMACAVRMGMARLIDNILLRNE
ncbi:MAG: pantoate--beta-alanine ligase [Desulfovibrio sp.]|jgi:pantoate--beta-alanine ligase|nr:pantoate--beta-alanine ligase [Desulfovibrio sp.]